MMSNLARLYAMAGDQGRAFEFYSRAIKSRPELATGLDRIRKAAN